MDKLFIRLTVIYIAVYFLSVFYLAWNGIEYFNDYYIALLEICVCKVMSTQGKYHCKYMKYTAYGVTCADVTTRLDNHYEFFPVDILLLVVASMVAGGILVTFSLALRHFYKVQQLKRKRHGVH